MQGVPRSGPSAVPALLIGSLYALLAVTDLVLLRGSARVLLAGAAVLAAGCVLALLLRRPDRVTAWAAATIAVLTLAPHVGVAASRPLVVVMLALSAASAWGALMATGMRPQRREDAGDDVQDAEVAPQPVHVDAAGAPPVEPLEDAPEVATDPRTRLMEVAVRLVAGAVVSLVEPDGSGNLVISACTRPGLVGLTFAAGSTSATEHTYRTGRRLFLADPRSEPLVSPVHLNRTRAASMLWQPVRVTDVPCAVLVVGWAERVEDVPPHAVPAINLLAEEAAGFLAHESLLADLRHFESVDMLTGLDSRAAWDAQLGELMTSSRDSGQDLVVAIVDLDHFGAFNDTHGQAAGDAHLARFARAARATLRCDGLIARWGGEQFAVALTAVTPDAAHRVLDRVRLAVPDGRTCSIGFAVWDYREPCALLLGRADRGMQRAKEAGRNRICQAS